MYVITDKNQTVMKLDVFNWFLETNQKEGATLEGAKLVRKSNVSIVVFVPDFDDIILSKTAYNERYTLEFRADNIRKVANGYEIQIFAYQDNNLMINKNYEAAPNS